MRKATFKQIVGTGYKGAVKCTYADLVKALGKPHANGSLDGKVQAQWGFIFPKETVGGTNPVVTVYDYKEYNTPVEQVRDWHIGGKRWIAEDFGVGVVCAALESVDADYEIAN